jgi:O-antigen/teichoic acid export membrane protein
MVIARSLPLAEVGLLEMLMLCGYLMTFFWSDALLKGYLANSTESTAKLNASAFLWFTLIASLFAMTILVTGQRFLLPFLVHRTALFGLVWFAFYQAFIIPVWIVPFVGLLKKQNPLLLSIYVLIGPSFACWAGYWSLPDSSGVLIGLMSYALVGFVWVLANTSFVRELRIKQMIIAIWPGTWPLILYAVSTGIARSFDAWLVARYFDESSFAIFRYGAREFPLVVAFAAGLSTIMIPRLKQDTSLSELKDRSKRLMLICYPIVAVVMFLSPVLFDFFFGAAFRGSAIIFNIYLLLTLTQLVFPQSIMTARGDARWMWYISLAELGVNILASLILLHYFGITGIVWGTLIAFTFEKAVMILVLRKRYDISPGSIFHLRSWISFTLLLSFVFIMTKWVFGL